ncbi:MAG: hypothetical protein GVY02_08705 [Bacteroidetes bacterium]|nr:hypothetical protein [Bacteroidota bacterium]
MKKIASLLLLLAVILLFKSCATPSGPTGGEPDRQGPKVVSTSPPTGTTNFEGNEVEIEFDQFIERNSLRQNVSIEPDLGIEFEIDFGRKSATVEFLSPLPENTTVIIGLGTEITDTDRNEMDQPYNIALSTGDELDSAKLSARLLSAETGEGESGWRVFLYAEPFDIKERSKYVAQSDTAGRVQFEYLSEGTYKAFWIEDVNRNRTWEPEREDAQPFYVNTFELQKDDSLDIGTLFVNVPDTIGPEIEGVGLLTEHRLRLRLTEEVIWDTSSVISIQDTLGTEFTTAIPLYTSEQEPTVLFARSFDPLADSLQFVLFPDQIEDEAGNPMQPYLNPFVGSSQPDTTELRTISHNAGSGLYPDEPLEITYSTFIDDPAVVDSLIVVEGDRIREEWPFLEADNHILRINPEEQWEAGVRYQFRIWDPWNQERELVDPDIWQRSQLGGIEFLLEGADSLNLKRMTLTDMEESIRLDTTFTESSILIDNLPPLEYKARIFEDQNSNKRWDEGEVMPYKAPEPYAVRSGIPVREGFTSEVRFTIQSSENDELLPAEDIPEETNEN